MLFSALYRFWRKIDTIENADAISRAVFAGEVRMPRLLCNKTELILRLTLEVPYTEVEGIVYKHFYLVRNPIGGSQYGYKLMCRRDQPMQVVLLNTLPLKVYRYIKEWEGSRID